MPKGKFGGPRPFAEARLVYSVTFSGPSELETNPKKAPEVFEKGSRVPQQDAFQFFIEQVGNVLLAVNYLASPSRAVVHNIEIIEQEEQTASWRVEYFLRGQGMGEFGRIMTGASNMCDAQRVLVEGDSTPVDNRLAVKRGRFEPGPFVVERITVKAL